jgi:hypothetical protein
VKTALAPAIKTTGLVSFSPEPPKASDLPPCPAKSPRPALYLTRSKKAPIQRKGTKKPYKSVTFLRLTLPIAVQGIKGFQTAESDLFAALHEIWETLLSVDPNKTHILPWYDPDQGTG